MAFVVGLLLVVISLDLAKNCKAVNHEFTHYGYKSEYITGCNKGCFFNTSDADAFEDKGTGGKLHPSIKKCAPCENIKGNVSYSGLPSPNDTAEYYCNSQLTCHWQGGKCKAVSCPLLYRKESCCSRHEEDRPDGKKYCWKDGKCKKYEVPAGTCKEGCDSSYANNVNGLQDVHGNPLPITDSDELISGADKIRTQCKYVCDHPDYEEKHKPDRHGYEYTKAERLYAHRVLGCLYAQANAFSAQDYEISSPVQYRGVSFNSYGVIYGHIYPSRWSVWAFVLTLVLLILFAVGVIAAVVVLVFVGGSSSKSSSKA